jgi:cytochrome oxidase Cu insertion factor (SCO1/SenC/PrrC family)
MRLPIAIVGVASLLSYAGCSPISPRATNDSELAARLPDADGSDLFAFRPQARQLEIGDEVPDFELRDPTGASLNLSELRGRVIVMIFFTAANDPEGGHELLARLGEVAHALGSRLIDRVVLMPVLISDSGDADARLSDASASVPQDGPRWLFVRAGPEPTALLATAFRVVMWKDADGNIGHTFNTVVIDPRGRFFDRFPGLDAWSPIDVVAATNLAANR